MKNFLTTLSLALSMTLGCVHGGYTRGTNEFKACAKADFSQIATSSGLPVLVDVANKIRGNAPALENDLTSLALDVGVDTVKCAIAALETAWSSSSSGGASHAAPSPGLLRAEAWVAKH